MLEISADGGKIQTMKQKNNYILNLYKFLGKLIKSECLNIFRSCDINNEMLTAGLLGPPRPGRVKTLTADEKYSLLNRDNLMQPIQMQLSQKQKTFSEFLSAILISRVNFKICKKR